MKLSDFNDKHLGETIYIIGCAPTLNRLTDKEIQFLNKSITIGVNFSHLKINLKYWIGGHVEQTVFALESDLPPSVPLFAHIEDRTRYITQIWNSERVIPVNDLTPRLPLTRYIDEKQNLYGSTSIILSAIHLAYIMGASKIVYLGFEGKNALHFYTDDEIMKKETIKKIKTIMLSGIYKSEINYNVSFPFWNVHRAFELMLNENVPNGHFGKKEILKNRSLNYFEENGKNWSDIKKYISFLNNNNIKTFTLGTEEMMVKAECEIISDVWGVL